MRGLWGVLVIGLLIAAGNNTPFFGLFYDWLPGYAGFRIHARAAVLVVFVLICAAGIWLGRPHPRGRAWWSYLFGVPIRYGVVGLLLLQSLDLLQGTWMIKRVYTYGAIMILKAAPDRSFERTLAAELRQAAMADAVSAPAAAVCAAVIRPGELWDDLPLRQLRRQLLAVPADGRGTTCTRCSASPRRWRRAPSHGRCTATRRSRIATCPWRWAGILTTEC